MKCQFLDHRRFCAVADCVGPYGGINDVELGVHANDGAKRFVGFAGKPNCLVSEAVSAQGQEWTIVGADIAT
jgi:hypothetical protein